LDIGPDKKTMSVQHSLTDEGHGPHYEAGLVKENGQKDSTGRPKIQDTKTRVDY